MKTFEPLPLPEGRERKPGAEPVIVDHGSAAICWVDPV
jgi:hypothetical protein